MPIASRSATVICTLTIAGKQSWPLDQGWNNGGSRLVCGWGCIDMKAYKSTPILIFQWVNTGKEIAIYFSTQTNWFLGQLQGKEHRSSDSCFHTFLLRKARLSGWSERTALLWQIKAKTNVVTTCYTCTVYQCDSGLFLFQWAGKPGSASTWTK